VVFAVVTVFLFHRAIRMDPRFFAISPPGLWGLTLYVSGLNRAAAMAYREHWKHEMAGLTFEAPALVALVQGDLQTAERIARARLASEPANASALIAMAKIALARQTPQQALPFLERVQDPNAIDALFLQSVAHAQAENYGPAIMWATQRLVSGSETSACRRSCVCSR